MSMLLLQFRVRHAIKDSWSVVPKGVFWMAFGTCVLVVLARLTLSTAGSSPPSSLAHSGRTQVDSSFLEPAAKLNLTAISTAIPTPTIAAPAFTDVWTRTDFLVARSQVSRSWYWGPTPATAGLQEEYAQGLGGKRLVQYFDKARMEINNPSATPGPFYVTTGLLVVELMSGQMQTGNSNFVYRYPACIVIAGDTDDDKAPTYASFRNVSSISSGSDKSDADKTGQRATTTINRAGVVGNDPSKGSTAGGEYVHYVTETKHNIPRVFWDFLNQKGDVIEQGQKVNRQLSDPWFYISGYPVSDAYWVHVKVGGNLVDVLVQAYQRRVLTYNATNPAAFQVEMGNVGLHYYDWRYHNRGSCSAVGGCDIFPTDNVWNRRISQRVNGTLTALPTDVASDEYIRHLGTPVGSASANNVHPDFGATPPPGFQPIVIRNQPPVAVTFTTYKDQSDKGPYPIPTSAPIQGGPTLTPDADRHVLAVDAGNCRLYELYRAEPHAGYWVAESGVVWDLRSNKNVNPARTVGWTSADASGLPMLPGFVRYDEITAGEIRHALSFTAYRIQRENYIWPARHTDGRGLGNVPPPGPSPTPDVKDPPMGARFRLKDSVDIPHVCDRYFATHTHYTAADCLPVQIVLQALKDYGMILHDTGKLSTHELGIAGEWNTNWNDDVLVNVLRDIHVSDFEVVDEQVWKLDPNSMDTAP
jgi:hypothetical protein